jgi:hypothetical protein
VLSKPLVNVCLVSLRIKNFGHKCPDNFSKTEHSFLLLKLNLYIIYLFYVVHSGIQSKSSCLLHSPTKKDIVSFRELASSILDIFFAADYDFVLKFFPARQDFEIIGLLSVQNDLYCNI